MNVNPSTDEGQAAIEKFWRDYERVLEENRVPAQKRGFYVQDVQRFTAHFQGQRLRQRGRPEIERFLHHLRIGRHWTDWQVEQAAHALELLYRDLLKMEVGDLRGLARQISEATAAEGLSDAWRSVIEQMRKELRFRHYSIRTEQSYLEWAHRLAGFFPGEAPTVIGTEKVKAFLTHLALERKVAASTQNQAFNALLFLYREVLKQEFGQLEGVARARVSRRLPVVLSKEELRGLLEALEGTYALMGRLLYGTGMRLMAA